MLQRKFQANRCHNNFYITLVTQLLGDNIINIKRKSKVDHCGNEVGLTSISK